MAPEEEQKQASPNNNMLLTTLKVGSSSTVTKVTLKLRTAEGQLGSLSAFVVEKKAVPEGSGNDDPALCALLEIPLKPLNLHERVPGLEQHEMEQLPLSRIVVRGRFSQ